MNWGAWRQMHVAVAELRDDFRMLRERVGTWADCAVHDRTEIAVLASRIGVLTDRVKALEPPPTPPVVRTYRVIRPGISDEVVEATSYELPGDLVFLREGRVVGRFPPGWTSVQEMDA